MSEKCPVCDAELVELRCEKPTETAHSTDSSQFTYGPETYWGFYGYWCAECEQMYEPHSKRWLEPWVYQSCKESAKNG